MENMKRQFYMNFDRENIIHVLRLMDVILFLTQLEQKPEWKSQCVFNFFARWWWFGKLRIYVVLIKYCIVIKDDYQGVTQYTMKTWKTKKWGLARWILKPLPSWECSIKDQRSGVKVKSICSYHSANRYHIIFRNHNQCFHTHVKRYAVSLIVKMELKKKK